LQAHLLRLLSFLFYGTGRSVAWLARLLWEQEVESSNLSVPTIFSSVTAEEVRDKLGLEPHPEGGWFRRTYQSEECLHLERGTRFAGTSIYYLLSGEENSVLHCLKSDEIFYYHLGCGLTLHLFDEVGYAKKSLGPDLFNGEEQQIIIEAGTTFAAEPSSRSSWCLISCSVCPGFEFEDFDWGDTHNLIMRFPEHEGLLDRLSKEPHHENS
tara:strand:- start:176 stop:808 length:633 start_codon:yes stop_codon:yes gene_type:complete